MRWLHVVIATPDLSRNISIISKLTLVHLVPIWSYCNQMNQMNQMYRY